MSNNNRRFHTLFYPDSSDTIRTSTFEYLTGTSQIRPPAQSDKISLVVRFIPTNSTSNFKLRIDTYMSRLMDSYVQRQGIRRDSVYFMYNGQIIENHHTPEMLNMKNGDIILCTYSN